MIWNFRLVILLMSLIIVGCAANNAGPSYEQQRTQSIVQDNQAKLEHATTF